MQENIILILNSGMNMQELDCLNLVNCGAICMD